MRKVGSLIVMVIGLAVLGAMYFATPYLTRPQSHVVQFLEVLAAGCVVGFGVILLMAGVVMRGDKKPKPAPPKVAVPPKAAVDPTLEHELALIDSHVKQARNIPGGTQHTLSDTQRIEHLAVAMDSLMVMLKRRAGLK